MIKFLLVMVMAMAGAAVLASVMQDGRAKAYYCGQARGMKFVADKQGLNLGPVPISGCERFDHLDGAFK